MNMGQWERESGAVHEASNFNAGNEMKDFEPPTPKPSKELIHALAKDWAEAVASGPMTGLDKLL